MDCPCSAVVPGWDNTKDGLVVNPDKANYRDHPKEFWRCTVQNATVKQYFDARMSLTPRSLADEMSDYQRAAKQTQDVLNAYVRREYGIESFSDIVEEWWGSTDPTICLARQVITWSTEQLAFNIIADQMRLNGCTPELQWKILPFTSDGYGNHPYKESLIKVPTLIFNNGTTSIKHTELVSKEGRRNLQHGHPMQLSHILTDAGSYWGIGCSSVSLSHFHQMFWRKVTGSDPCCNQDASLFHSHLLRECMKTSSSNKPSTFFIERDGRAIKCAIGDWDSLSDAERRTARPPASWYYFFYLALFTTGTRVLFASLDDDDDVHTMFATMNEVEEACGKKPLLAAIPYKHTIGKTKLLFNEVNPTLLRVNAWDRAQSHCMNDEPTIYSRMLYIEEQLSRNFA